MCEEIFFDISIWLSCIIFLAASIALHNKSELNRLWCAIIFMAGATAFFSIMTLFVPTICDGY